MPDPGSPRVVAQVGAWARWRPKVGLNETSLWRIEAGRTKKPKLKTRQMLAPC
jgi:hypothetical protein